MPVDARRVKELFGAALDIPETAARESYLDRECGEDSELRQRLDALLKAHESPASAVKQPLAGEGTVAFAPNEKPGTMVAGRYKLLESIGEGGMGTVWVAEQTEPVKRKVAIKLIKAGMDSRSVLARFEAERQALALMDHPNIAKVLDGGMTEQGRPYFVMEYVKGVPITEYCDATRLSIHERLNLFIQVCQAVQHAHQKGIIHRDLKPSNILVAPYDDKPVPKIIDFGLAKAMHQSLTERTLHTAHESVLGTPLYMSPEQAQLNNLDVDTRSDIYSLGVLLYELLTGTTPLEKQRFKQAAWDEVRRIIREEEPPRPSTRLSSIDTLPSLAAGRHTDPLKLTRLIKGELDWIVMKALEKDRTRRYETANGFARDIQRYLSDEVVEARPASAGYRLKKMFARNKGKVLAASLILLALLVGVAVSTWQAIRATRAEHLALTAVDEERKAKVREAERAEGERQAKLDAEAKKTEAEAEKQRADEEKRIAQAVKDFLQKKLLAQADTKAQADTLLKAGGFAGEAKYNPTIKELLDRAAKELAADKIEANFPKQPLVQAQILGTVGAAYRGIGEAATGMPFQTRSVDLFRAKLGPDHPDTLESMNNLASGYHAAGQLDKALPLIEETLKLQKAKLGPDHPDTLTSMGNLAVGYEVAGQLDKALPLYEETLKLQKAKLGPDHPSTLNSMGNLAMGYKADGQLDRALPLFEETLKLVRANLGPDHPDTLKSMHNLASGYKAAGKLDRALPLFEETLKLARAKLGPDHPLSLASMGNLASGYQADGQLDRALPLYEETLKLMRAKLGPDHPSTLESMNNLAAGYQEAVQLDKALPLYEETLKLKKAKLGPDHPSTLESMNNLATGYQDAGKLDLALPLYEETLKLARAKLGPDHPQTLASIGNLAAGYHAAGQRDLALPLIEETLKLKKAKLGPEHPDTLASMNNLALGYRDAGQLDKALPLFEETLKLARAKLGPDHPQTLASIGNLAAGYHAAGQRDLALPLIEETLKLKKAKLGPDHPDTLASMNNLALGYRDAGKLDLALPLIEETLKLRKAKLGPEHPDTLQSINSLAACYWSLKRLDKSVPMFEQLLPIQEKMLGRGHPDTQRTVANLGVNYKDAGQLDKALPLFEEAYKLMKAKLGPEHPDTLHSMSNLAEGYLAAGNRDLALPLYEETLKIRKAKLGPDHPETLQSMNALGACYWSLKQLDKSVPLFEQLLPLREKKLGRGHPETQRTVANLGVNYKDAGRVKEALPLLEEAYRSSKKIPTLRWVGQPLLDAYGKAGQPAEARQLIDELLADARKTLPKDSPQLTGMIAQFGLSLLEIKGYAEAEPLLRECLTIREKTQPDAWTTFNTQSLLGGALLGQKKYAEAEPLLLKGYEGMKAREKTIPKEANTRIPEALDRLIQLYTETNKPDEVKKWQAEKDKLPKSDEKK